ncbi:MAG: hypothetical protein AUG46_08525 [Acidobacteria bacterium 13_1_20CM_3_58_11]|nr:MAG: hypothetical protein AUG46_08525 [Acidobacteria bacterium 13_1_20CM_3_58_11]
MAGGAHSSVQTHVLAESLESAAFVLQNLNSFRVKAYEKHGAGVSRWRFPRHPVRRKIKNDC